MVWVRRIFFGSRQIHSGSEFWRCVFVAGRCNSWSEFEAKFVAGRLVSVIWRFSPIEAPAAESILHNPKKKKKIVLKERLILFVCFVWSLVDLCSSEAVEFRSWSVLTLLQQEEEAGRRRGEIWGGRREAGGRRRRRRRSSSSWPRIRPVGRTQLGIDDPRSLLPWSTNLLLDATSSRLPTAVPGPLACADALATLILVRLEAWGRQHELAL